MSTMNEDVLRRIRKCLALATSTNVHEAEAAMRQAQKLMALHGIDEGMVDRAAIVYGAVHGLRGIRPTQWETRLVQTCCSAFGAHPLWCAGPKGGYLPEHNGKWLFLAPKSRVELVVYAYTVLVRQLLKARAEYNDSHHLGWTRVQKAKELDAFCYGYVVSLREKVAPYALEEKERLAIEGKKSEMVTGKFKAEEAKASAAAWDGVEQGKKAQFHAAAHGPEALKRLGA